VHLTTLRRALVAKTGQLANNSWDRFDKMTIPREWFEEDNILHQRLGAVAARHLSGHLRNGDSVGLASGRGPSYTVESFIQRSESNKTNFKGIEIVSLAGGIARQTGGKSSWSERSVNADQRTHDLAVSLGGSCRLVQLPLFVKPPKEDLISRTDADYLLDSDPPIIDLSMAVFGFGVLNRGHYLLLPETPQMLPDIRAVRQELDGVIEFLDRYPAPIVDVCQHFSVGTSVGFDEYARVGAIADALNRRIVTAAVVNINRAEERIAVGGGAQKYPALLQMLRGKAAIRPTTLVTDEVSASRLVDDLAKE
jgi:DNA-binding transcriptional regulator LsrR (DeoR family)